MRGCLIFFLTLVTYFSVSAAETKNLKSVQKSKESDYHFLLAFGSQYRPERDVNKDFAQHFYSQMALGAGFNRWMFVFERADFSESSGNATLNVERTYHDYLLWAQYSVYEYSILNAFAGGGAGVYQEKVTTNFAGQSSSGKTSYKLLTSAALGLRANVSVLFASLEARIFLGDELDQQPGFGAVLRAGVWF